MHLLNRKPLLVLLFAVLIGSSFVFAQNGPATVNFSLRTTDGQTITSGFSFAASLVRRS